MNPIDVKDPTVYRRRHGIPDAVGGCHTATVAGYAIEGHVPAREIRRILNERPKARGLAVAGMPAGSPGMESGSHKDAYDVMLVMPDGRTVVYAQYGR